MGKIVRQGVEYGGSSNSADCIKYNDTKSVKEAIDEIKASSSSNPTAASVTFDNANTGLAATNVQDAVTEVNGNFSGYPDYANAIDIKSYGSSARKYTCHQNGYILIKRLTVTANAVFRYFINGQSVSVISAGNSAYTASGILLPVKKGDVVYGDSYLTDYSEMYFISNR